MRNNLKNIALGVLGLLVLGLFGAFVSVSTETSQVGEVGRYLPIVSPQTDGLNFNILDTKTGRVYFTRDGERVYWDYVKGAKPSN